MSGFANRGPQDAGGVSSYSPGHQLFDPSIAASGGGRTTQDSITARAGGGRPNAVPFTSAICRITTCATAADSVALPPARGGQTLTVLNGGANAAQVFAAVSTSDTINGVAAATGVSLPAAKSATFWSPAVGVWFWNLSA
jgi:hypothetical protein